nr:hypothetical protein [Tanacetum cinerariifolium]
MNVPVSIIVSITSCSQRAINGCGAYGKLKVKARSACTYVLGRVLICSHEFDEKLDRVSLTSKAENALKELEKKNSHKNLSAFQHLITLYGKTENGYRCVHLTIFGLQMFLWEVISAKPNAKTWEIFMNYYLEKGEIESAVNCIDNAISTGRGNGEKWVPETAVVKKFMEHFEGSKDVDGAEGFVGILSKIDDNVGGEVLESLIRIYAASGKMTPVLRRRVKMENIELSSEGKTLLETISV